ncbi:DUF742 domain-containing protein [Sanguibacter antarcticus]|jgi:Protein of unknown function (DUF742)|uniref:Uncharacterized protein DUF742 n=1 Tax=Sanguibacter antarcticus TaxID=372484 RepID=A0A2A9E676_9MICO|nr:DUF742 domain-containing protein [Sanguibacter antarcticus]PFG34557.1 uncharacterized protein DUF742 [Sanguibacter antarcticus]
MSNFTSNSHAMDGEHFEAATVRPYAVTGGRVRSATSSLPLETLIEVMPGAVDSRGLPPEKRSILSHAAHNYVSIAEVSALLRMPLGVVRILIADLADDGFLTIHTSTPVNVHTGHGQNPALSLSVLESVLNGISAL